MGAEITYRINVIEKRASLYSVTAKDVDEACEKLNNMLESGERAQPSHLIDRTFSDCTCLGDVIDRTNENV